MLSAKKALVSLVGTMPPAAGERGNFSFFFFSFLIIIIIISGCGG